MDRSTPSPFSDEGKQLDDAFLSEAEFIREHPKLTKGDGFLFEVTNLCGHYIQDHLALEGHEDLSRNIPLLQEWARKAGEAVRSLVLAHCLGCPNRCPFQPGEDGKKLFAYRFEKDPSLPERLPQQWLTRPTKGDFFTFEMNNAFGEFLFDDLEKHLSAEEADFLCYFLAEGVYYFIQECNHCPHRCLKEPGKPAIG